MAFDVSTITDPALEMLAAVSSQASLVFDRIIILSAEVTEDDIKTQPLTFYTGHESNVSSNVTRSFLSAGRVANEATARIVLSLKASERVSADVSAKTIIITAHVVEAGQTVVSEAPFYGISDADGLTLPVAAVVPLSIQLALEFGFSSDSSISISGETVENFLLSSEADRFVSAHSVASSASGDDQIVRGVKTFADNPKIKGISFYRTDGSPSEDWSLNVDGVTDSAQNPSISIQGAADDVGSFIVQTYNGDDVFAVNTANGGSVLFPLMNIKFAPDDDHGFPSMIFNHHGAKNTGARIAWNKEDDYLGIYYSDENGEESLFAEFGAIGTNGNGVRFSNKVICEENLFARGLGADSVDADLLDTHTDGVEEIKIARPLVPDPSVYDGDIDINLGSEAQPFKNGYFEQITGNLQAVSASISTLYGIASIQTPMDRRKNRRRDLEANTGAILPNTFATLGSSSRPWRGYFSTINGAKYPAVPSDDYPVGCLMLCVFHTDSDVGNIPAGATFTPGQAFYGDSNAFAYVANWNVGTGEFEVAGSTVGRAEISEGTWAFLSGFIGSSSGGSALVLMMRIA